MTAESLLAATLPVSRLAAESVGALSAAIESLLAVRDIEPPHHGPGSVTTASLQRIAASFMGDRMLRLDGAPVRTFAEFSGFFRASDGWIRTHANYPHHRAALRTALGLAESDDSAALADRVAGMASTEIEELCAGAGALAVRVRTENEWFAHAAGAAARSGPLIARTVRPTAHDDRTDPAVVRPAFTGRSAARPLAGIRVLDLTRVIAGPVATRALALLGADVLRIDPPGLPEIEWQHLENGQGKRSACVDLDSQPGREIVQRLLASADVLVTGYRPGALSRFGIDVSACPRGLVHGSVSAWGNAGPWRGRRGFDSLVQAASGMAFVEGSDDEPGRLPAQALDHASGYLLASGIVTALCDRVARPDGPGVDIEVSLARVAAWLTALPGRTPSHGPAALPDADTLVTHGRVTTARPVFDAYADYPFPAHVWGSDEARWDFVPDPHRDFVPDPHRDFVPDPHRDRDPGRIQDHPPTDEVRT